MTRPSIFINRNPKGPAHGRFLTILILILLAFTFLGCKHKGQSAKGKKNRSRLSRKAASDAVSRARKFGSRPDLVGSRDWNGDGVGDLLIMWGGRSKYKKNLRFSMLDGKQGAMLWQKRFPGIPRKYGAALLGRCRDVILLRTAAETLIALEANKGKKRWNLDLKKAGLMQHRFNALSITAAGEATNPACILNTKAGGSMVLDGQTGALLWQAKTPLQPAGTNLIGTVKGSWLEFFGIKGKPKGRTRLPAEGAHLIGRGKLAFLLWPKQGILARAKGPGKVLVKTSIKPLRLATGPRRARLSDRKPLALIHGNSLLLIVRAPKMRHYKLLRYSPEMKLHWILRLPAGTGQRYRFAGTYRKGFDNNTHTIAMSEKFLVVEMGLSLRCQKELAIHSFESSRFQHLITLKRYASSVRLNLDDLYLAQGRLFLTLSDMPGLLAIDPQAKKEVWKKGTGWEVKANAAKLYRICRIRRRVSKLELHPHKHGHGDTHGKHGALRKKSHHGQRHKLKGQHMKHPAHKHEHGAKCNH